MRICPIGHVLHDCDVFIFGEHSLHSFIELVLNICRGSPSLLTDLGHDKGRESDPRNSGKFSSGLVDNPSSVLGSSLTSILQCYFFVSTRLFLEVFFIGFRLDFRDLQGLEMSQVGLLLDDPHQRLSLTRCSCSDVFKILFGCVLEHLHGRLLVSFSLSLRLLESMGSVGLGLSFCHLHGIELSQVGLLLDKPHRRLPLTRCSSSDVLKILFECAPELFNSRILFLHRPRLSLFDSCFLIPYSVFLDFHQFSLQTLDFGL